MRWINKIKSLVTSIKKVDSLYDLVKNDYKSPKMNLGQIQIGINQQRKFQKHISDFEFQVFSQWGDDGIIQFLTGKLDIPNKTFVEFGVETYKESNTRFLMLNNNWSGLVIDGSDQAVNFIKNDTISWTHELFATQAFITKDNINLIITKEFIEKGFDSEIGILSIDIDGNDYWVWNELKVIKPIIVIAEYNASLGLRPYTIPYQSDFVMDLKQDPFYWGVSLKALCELAVQKGYSFIGCNSNGNNAYFIRDDKLGTLPKISCEDGFRASKYRLKFNADRSPWTNSDVRKSLAGKEFYNVQNQKTEVY